MRTRLEQRQTSLADRIQALLPNAEAEGLSETDLQKILEDSWVILDEGSFNDFARCLGVIDGRIRSSAFQAKFEEATAGAGGHGSLLTTAEQNLAALKARIKVRHGNSLNAFRLMDQRCRGVVDRQDFKVLYNSLGFYCSEAEYERLLGLIGLHPGANLNYAEFAAVVENNGKRRPRSADELQQLHQLLASEARIKWADMSKVLCQSDAQTSISKNSLRRLLFSYALPLASTEFDQLWSRYDPEGRGSVPVADFLEKLGFQGQKPDDQQPTAGSASLEQIKQVLQHSSKEASEALSDLARTEGSVAVDELLNLLHSYDCSVSREQLLDHLRRLRVSMDDGGGFGLNCQRPPPPTPDAVQQIESLDSLSLNVALDKLRERVTSSAPDLYKAFSAFDQDGTGLIKALEFRRVLESFCARPTDKQYRHLLTKLELDSEKSAVNWKDFLSRFQCHSPGGPDGTLRGSVDPGLTSPLHTSTTTESPQQIPELVPGDLKTTKEPIALEPSTTVSKEHLRQLYDRRCPSLTNHQFECVWRQMVESEQRNFEKHGRSLQTKAESLYSNQPSPAPEPRDPRSAVGRCPNRAALLRVKSAPQCPSRRPSSVGRPGTVSPPGSMERRLRGEMQRCWKEIQRKCAAEDSQRDGLISASSFLGILQSLSISTTQEQLDHLAVKFSFMRNGRVSYQTFLQHFLLNLNPTETTKAFERLKLPLPITAASRGVLSPDCVDVLLRTYDAVRSSWTSIRRSFLTSDRGRTGTVSAQDFRKVLGRFSVSLSEDEFFHLCSYFDAKSTGSICYNNFLWAFLH